MKVDIYSNSKNRVRNPQRNSAQNWLGEMRGSVVKGSEPGANLLETNS